MSAVSPCTGSKSLVTSDASFATTTGVTAVGDSGASESATVTAVLFSAGIFSVGTASAGSSSGSRRGDDAATGSRLATDTSERLSKVGVRKPKLERGLSAGSGA